MASILDNFKKYGSAFEDFGKVAAGISAGRAAGRTTQADFNLRSGEAQQNADVVASDANARRRAAALSDALRGRLLQGTKDAEITSPLPYGVNVPTIAGGSRPSNITGAAELGKQLAAHGDAAMNAPDIKAQNFDNLAPGPNALDTIFGLAGQGTSLLSTFGKVAPLFKGGAPSAAASLLSKTGSIPGVGVPTSAITSGVPAVAGKTATDLGGKIGGKLKAGGVGGILGGFQTINDIAHGNVTGATINGAMTGFKYGGPIGAAVGAGIGAVGAAIRKNMNITKGGREEFARKQGFGSLHDFNQYLETLGPAGAAAKQYGENVVGKHNDEQQNHWFALAQEAIDRGGGNTRKPVLTGMQQLFGRG